MNESRAMPVRAVALACFLGTCLLAVGLGVVWAREAGQPRVVLLGSGGSVSVLVAAGDARLLLATGSDPASFAAAVEAARQPVHRRIDVLLAAGRGDDLLVPAAIAEDERVRLVATLGPVEIGPGLESLAERPALTASRRIALDGDTTVLLEAARPAGVEGDEAAHWAWRATVARGDARVVVLSDGTAATHFPPPRSPSLVVVAGRNPLAAIGPGAGSAAPVIAFADRVLSPRSMRESDDAVSANWAIRVFDGEAIAIPLTDTGLVVPAEAAVPLGAPAAATPGP